MTRRRWWIAIGLCCVMGLPGCAKTKMYERHVEPAYDAQGAIRPGYAAVNLDFLDALDADLQACYADKKP